MDDKAVARDFSELRSHPVLAKMEPDQIEHLAELLYRKAWARATDPNPELPAETKKRIASLDTPEEQAQAREYAYNLNLWRALKWYLFGGLVDVDGLCVDPFKAYDPVSNPYIKVPVSGWVRTVDEHEDPEHSRKPLPDKRYLRLLAQAWVFEPLIAVPKSRQMMVTWLFCAIGSFELLFRDNRLTGFISKRELDADKHLVRTHKIIKALPKRFGPPQASKKFAEMNCEETGSSLLALSSDPEAARQFTFSWAFFDEAAFADYTDEIIEAVLPSTKGSGGSGIKGRFTLVSTPDGKDAFYRVVSNSGSVPMPVGK